MHLTGGCLCGAVRYESTGEIARRFLCHCRDCKRAGGSAFHFGLTVPRAGFRLLQGEPRAYRTTGESGRAVTRLFCPTCGAGVLIELELRPDFVVLRAGTLDEPERVAPAYEVFARSKAAWLSTGDIPSHRDMTPPSA
jgi:hypothetical protein